MRIGVTGGRDYDNVTRVRQVLKVLDNLSYGSDEQKTLVHGAAPGADSLCAREAYERPDLYDWVLDPHKADWNGPCRPECNHGARRKRPDGSTYCQQAGPNRNQDMVDSGLDVLIAFPGGTGTEDMVRRAKAAGVLVLRVED